MRRIDIAGKRFGKWTAIRWASFYSRGSGGYSLWKCKCDCGTVKEVSLSALKARISTNCGCTHHETRIAQYAKTDLKPGHKTKFLTILGRAEDTRSKSGRVNKRYNA